MGVISVREISGRTLQQRIGEAPNTERRFVVTVDDPATNSQSIINAVGIGHGDAHPEFGFLANTDSSLAENAGSPYHIELIYKYELLKQDFEPNPLLRPDVWSFSVGGATVPAITYFEAGNQRQLLVNSANDFFETATTEEAEIRATITGNRASFPMQLAAYVTNSLNEGPYLGGASYTWKCAGIGGQQATEVVNEQEVRYYQITSELVYRASGWPLLLPDVGWNYLENGLKRRAWVEFIEDDGTATRVPSANPVALGPNGKMLAPGKPPRILSRRVHRAVPFSTYFGTPSF